MRLILWGIVISVVDTLTRAHGGGGTFLYNYNANCN